MAGKCIKGKDWLTTPQIRNWISEKTLYIRKINKNISKKEIKEYFNNNNFLDNFEDY